MRKKGEFAKLSVEFLGTIVNVKGMQVDPKTVEAITEIAALKDPSEVRRPLGMVNQLSKFQPHKAELTKPLRDLLSTNNHWTWGEILHEAFSSVKNSLASTPKLALYDARAMSYESYRTVQCPNYEGSIGHNLGK